MWIKNPSHHALPTPQRGMLPIFFAEKERGPFFNFPQLFPAHVGRRGGADEARSLNLILPLFYRKARAMTVSLNCKRCFYGLSLRVEQLISEMLSGGEIQECWIYYKELVGEFCRELNLNSEEILAGSFVKIKPQTHRPYGRLYAY